MTNEIDFVQEMKALINNLAALEDEFMRRSLMGFNQTKTNQYKVRTETMYKARFIIVKLMEELKLERQGHQKTLTLLNEARAEIKAVEELQKRTQHWLDEFQGALGESEAQRIIEKANKQAEEKDNAV